MKKVYVKYISDKIGISYMSKFNRDYCDGWVKTKHQAHEYTQHQGEVIIEYLLKNKKRKDYDKYILEEVN